jgi:hypothetical protein
MADNVTLNAATVGGGSTIGADDISGIKYQRVKLITGVDGTNDGDVSSSSPLPTLATPVELRVAQTSLLGGKVAQNVNIMGRRTVFSGTTPFQDVATYLIGGQAALSLTVAATQYFIVSTSAQDAVGGTGMRAIRITYLDGSGNTQTVTPTLTGTTKVNLGTGFSAIQWMEAATLGSATSAACVGNVAIFSGAGAAAAEATTIEQILAGGNRSLSGRFKVPTGYSAFLTGWTANAPGNQSMDCRLRADCFSDDRTLSAGIFHFQDTAFMAAGSAPHDSPLPYLKCPAGTQIKLSCYPGATSGTPRVDATFELLLVAD